MGGGAPPLDRISPPLVLSHIKPRNYLDINNRSSDNKDAKSIQSVC